MTVSVKLLTAIKAIGDASRSAVLIATEEPELDGELIKRLASIHGEILALIAKRQATAAVPKK